MNKNNRSRSTNNPYLTGVTPQPATRLTLGTELKRLLGSPLRLFETLVFALAPLLFALAGALDLLTAWLYLVSHHVELDDRPTIKLVDCLLDQTKSLCQGKVWASPSSPQRIVLYPWHDFDLINRFEPHLFIAYFAFGLVSLVMIGNPNAARMGLNLKRVLGIKPAGEEPLNNKNLVDLATTSKDDKAVTMIPRGLLEADHPDKFWRTHMLLGQFVPRHWESDPGYFWFDKEAKAQPYWLNLHIMRTGLVIVAPQGSGKTASVFKPLRNFMERSGSMGIFYDVKSSENANGSGTDFPPNLFNLNFDAARSDSIKLNLFSGQTPAQAGERLAEALIPDLGGDKAYFSSNAKSAMATIVACFHALYQLYPTLVEILSFLSDPAALEDLNTQLNSRLGKTQPQEAFRLSTLLRRVINLSDNKNTDTLGSLATALEPLVTDVAARLLVTNPEPGAFSIEELLKEPRLVRLALPIANNPRIYPIIGRLVLAQFTYAVLSPECNRGIFKLIAVDEARFFITDNVANGMAQARSNNAGFALSFQTLTQVRDEVLLDNIFANAGTKIVMGKVSDKDAERYSRLFGTIELPYVSHSSGTTQGTNKNSGSSYSRGLEFEMLSTGTTGHDSRTTRSKSGGRGTSAGSSLGTNLSTRSRRRFLDSEVRELEQRHAIIESSDDQGRVWFAQVVNMDFGVIAALEKKVNEQVKRQTQKRQKNKKPLSLVQPEQVKSQTQGEPSAEPGHNFTIGQRVKISFLPVTPPTADQPSPASVPLDKILQPAPVTTVPDSGPPMVVETAPDTAIEEAAPEPAPTPAPAMAQASVEIQPEIEPDPGAVELSEIEQILAGLDLDRGNQEKAIQILLKNGRTAADLKRLVDYSRSKNPEHLGAYVLSMVRKDIFPAYNGSKEKGKETQNG